MEKSNVIAVSRSSERSEEEAKQSIKRNTMEQLLAALKDDFVGFDTASPTQPKGHEQIRQMLMNRTPKYGNDDDYADDVMVALFEAYFEAVDGRKNTKNGTYHINLLPTTVHVYFGLMLGATSDGRKAWQPLSEGVSPVQGADRRGPPLPFTVP